MRKRFTALLPLLTAFTAWGCFIETEPLSAWKRYSRSAHSALDSLSSLRSIRFDESTPSANRAAFVKTHLIVYKFLSETKGEKERDSRSEIKSAFQDLKIVAELMERQFANADTFAEDKLFAGADEELFRKVKERYKMGSVIALASRSYYFIPAIVTQARRSADRHIRKAKRRLEEESITEAKASRIRAEETLKGKR